MANPVVHFEIPAEDVERARAFYGSAFDWQLNSMEGMGYTLIATTPTDEQSRPTEPGAINGGMLEKQGPIQSPVITIQVDDIEAACAKIEDLGGKIELGKMPVGDMGFSAYFTDTEGNVMGLWEVAS